MEYMIGVAIGLTIGGAAGFFVCALLNAAHGRTDPREFTQYENELMMRHAERMNERMK